MVDHVTIISESPHPRHFYVESDNADDPKKERKKAKDILKREEKLILEGNFHGVGYEPFRHDKEEFMKMISAETELEFLEAVEASFNVSLEETGVIEFLTSSMESEKEEKLFERRFKKWDGIVLDSILKIFKTGIKVFPIDASKEEFDKIALKAQKFFLPFSETEDKTDKKKRRAGYVKLTPLGIIAFLRYPIFPIRYFFRNVARRELDKIEKELSNENLGKKKRAKLWKQQKKIKEQLRKTYDKSERQGKIFAANIPGIRELTKLRTTAFLKHVLDAIDYFHNKGIKDVRIAIVCGAGHEMDLELGFGRRIKGLETLLKKKGIDVKVEPIVG